MIAMSTSPKDHGHARNAGFDAFVRKGDLQQLSATIKYVADYGAWRRPLLTRMIPRLSGDYGARL
jgi:hypothetical protein